MTEPTNHCPARADAPPDHTPTATPGQEQPARSDATVLRKAITATYRVPGVPTWLCHLLADVLAAATVDAANGPGVDHRTVTLARALLDPPETATPEQDPRAAVIERLQDELHDLRDQVAAPSWRVANTLGVVDQLAREGALGRVRRGEQLVEVAFLLRQALTSSPHPAQSLPGIHAGATPMCATWPTPGGVPVEVLADRPGHVGGAAESLRRGPALPPSPCCGGTGLADYAAVPCQAPECTAPIPNHDNPSTKER